MSDFTLSITHDLSGLTVTATGGKQVTVELPELAGLAGAEAGRRLYQQVFSGPVLAEYRASEPHRVMIFGAEEVLDWPWQRLHDGVWPLALRHPLVLLPSECEQAPAAGVQVKDGPLWVLRTLVPDEEHAALGAAVDQWIDQLEQRYAGWVKVRKVRVTGGYQGLRKVFQQALAPFHLWQHVGPSGPGLALRLGEEVMQARDLNTLLAQQEAGCCMVLATHGEAPSASALSQLRAPFVLCQTARPGAARDLGLLRGFYERLLTHDLAVAGTLGQLEAYREGSVGEGWGNLTMVAHTTRTVLSHHAGIPDAAYRSVGGPTGVAASSSQPLSPERKIAFISFSQADVRFFEQLKLFLAPFERSGEITTWDPTRIQPGARREMEIANALNSARVAILLVSAHFFASEEITKHQLPPLLAAVREEGVKIANVLLGPSVFERSALAEFGAINDRKPLGGLPEYEQAEAWNKVAFYIHNALRS